MSVTQTQTLVQQCQIVLALSNGTSLAVNAKNGQMLTRRDTVVQKGKENIVFEIQIINMVAWFSSIFLLN